jgi:hypothetical protein
LSIGGRAVGGEHLQDALEVWGLIREAADGAEPDFDLLVLKYRLCST